ncbi:MAG: hypothetical protein ABIC95_04810 [archaeon]
MADTKPEPYYVPVKDSVDIKRNVLEASKQLIHSLQKLEALKAVRYQKTETLAKIKTVMKEIEGLNTELKLLLPKVKEQVPEHVFNLVTTGSEKVAETEPVETAATKSQPVHRRPHPKAPHQQTEMEKLDHELRDIEKQLSKLV